MNIYFNYDNLSQKYDAPVATFNYYDVQRFVPYVTRQNKAWCMYHQQWEQVFVNYGENNSGPFSTLLLACGMPLNNRIGLNRNWNRNQFCLEIDENKMVLRVKEKYTYDEIHDKQDYHIKNVYGKYFDFANGRIFYPKLFNLKMIPDFAVEYLDNFFSSCCKQLYGKEIKRNNAPMYDFVKYPTCPSFSKLIKYIDNGSFYNFRQELNLFKEFCSWMNIKETKKLRKAFMKEPRTLLIYAMCQQLGFSDTNAIQIIAENQLFFNKYAENNNRLRFSMNRHEVYMDNTFFNNQDNYCCNLIDSLRLWVQNALTDKTQIVVARRLLKFMTEEDFYTLKDCGEYYLLHARELPVPLHERILQEGFTEQIHNQEMHLEKSHSSLEVVDIEYTEEELEFEIILSQEGVKKYCSTGNVENAAFSKIRNSVISKTQNDSTDEEMKNLVDDDEEQVEVNDFKQELVLPEIKSSFEIAKYLKTNENAASDYYFILPKNTNELYEISDNMRNCVGYLYRSKVIEKACVIIVMMHNKRFVACIELRKMEDLRYHIVQLKGPMNKAVIGINYEVVKLWAKKFSIQMS